MNNIKTVKVINPIYGLNKDSELSRKSNEDNFVYSHEIIGDDYINREYLELDEKYISKADFEVVEWFNKIVTNKQKIALLEEDVLNLTKQLEDSEASLNKFKKRIDAKLAEYRNSVKRLEIEDDFYFSSGHPYSSASKEAATVYANMIELLEKLKA